VARGSASDGLSEFGALRSPAVRVRRLCGLGLRGLALCGSDGCAVSGCAVSGCAGPTAVQSRAARSRAVGSRAVRTPTAVPATAAMRFGPVPDRGCAASSGPVGPGPYAHRVRIDLHTHSTASDGTDTPAQLIRRAKAAGLDVVALTDHDTAAGWAEAAAALPAGLTLVPGTEFSCAWFGPNGARVGLHLLGYLYDPDDEELQAERRRLRQSRRGRGQAIVNNLRADDIPVTWERVAELAGDGTVGRPHIGQALVEAGVVSSLDEAFANLLSSRSRYYVRKADMDVFVALRLINAAGGVTAFAHPLARRRGPVVGDEVIADMAAAGLDGIEVDHPDHSFADRAHLSDVAANVGLIRLGSSDYHGRNKAVRLGACTTSPETYADLLARNTASSPIVFTT
jgi:3',5'-nucleoside bisphosphate phosphatase